MPRKARTVLPGVAHHVVQRHNRQVAFATEEDFQFCLDDVAELKVTFGVKLYAYCLMTNHVHLLLAPTSTEGQAVLLKPLAARQTRCVNRLGALRNALGRALQVQPRRDSELFAGMQSLH